TYQRTRARALHRRRALVRVVSRGASPVTTRCPIQIRSHPLVETKESSHLVNQFESKSVSKRLFTHHLPIIKLHLIYYCSSQLFQLHLYFLYSALLVMGLSIHYLICPSIQMLCRGRRLQRWMKWKNSLSQT